MDNIIIIIIMKEKCGVFGIYSKKKNGYSNDY